MSANHAKDFETRKASAMETVRWLLPALHRAIDFGDERIELSVRDVKELLSYLEASAHREKVEFSGLHLGYADPAMMRDLLTRKRASIPTLFKTSPRYSVEVFYRELEPTPHQLERRRAFMEKIGIQESAPFGVAKTDDT